VQLMNSARRSLKFQRLCSRSSSCFAVSVTRARSFRRPRSVLGSHPALHAPVNGCVYVAPADGSSRRRNHPVQYD
jgi:hypothetical protein